MQVADFSFQAVDKCQKGGAEGESGGGPRPEGAGPPAAPSLSFRNNSILKSKNAIAKKAETLFLNLDNLIKRRGIERCGFTTLTFIENITCRREAQRRFNSLATNFLRSRGLEFIAVAERQGRGAIHFHLACAFPFDIRSGFNFDDLRRANAAENSQVRRAIERDTNFYNANSQLRLWWRELAGAAKRFHFGRCETLPIKSNAQAVARYVGSYVGKQFATRQSRDKGMRSVRYSLEYRVAHPSFSWAKGPAQNWRSSCALLSQFLDLKDLSKLGKKWSWQYRELIYFITDHGGVLIEMIPKLAGKPLNGRLRALWRAYLQWRMIDDYSSWMNAQNDWGERFHKVNRLLDFEQSVPLNLLNMPLRD